MALVLKLKRNVLQNVDDVAGRWQYEGGQVYNQKEVQVAWYASTKRVIFGSTDAQNTAMLTTTLFFLPKKPPENITLQGAHDFNSGNEIGSVSAASTAYTVHIGKQFTRIGDVITIH
jgi:hypothetical protein